LFGMDDWSRYAPADVDLTGRRRPPNRKDPG
jgi:hypothetical protein